MIVKRWILLNFVVIWGALCGAQETSDQRAFRDIAIKEAMEIVSDGRVAVLNASDSPVFDYLVSRIEFTLNKEAAVRQWQGVDPPEVTGRRKLLASGADNCRTPRSGGASCTKMKDKSYIGKIFKVIKSVKSVDACCQACTKRVDCTSWTYKPRSVNKKLAGCYLRSAGSKRIITYKGYWSGYVHGRKDAPVPSPPPPEEYVYEDPNYVNDGPSPLPVPSPSPSPSPSIYSPSPSSPDAPKLPGGKGKYADVLKYSWMFYEAQRSGEEPSWNRIDWRGTSHMSDPVIGGWYDAGDTLKLNFPLAASLGYIGMGLVEFDKGYRQSSQKKWALRNYRIGINYLFDCLDIKAGTYVGQIGDPKIDHNYWGRPEEQKLKRPAYVYKKSMAASDLYGAVSGALTIASMVFDKEKEPKFADELLKAAKELFTWGDGNPGKYSNFYKQQTKVYKSGDTDDSMAWAAGWLYRATKDSSYLSKAQKYFDYKAADVYPGWDSLWAGHAVHMVSLADRGMYIPGESEYRRFLDSKFYRAWLKADGYQDIVRTPLGMVYPRWNKWANLAFSTTASALASVTAKYTKDSQQRDTLLKFAQGQVDYALGANGIRSYVIGYGHNYPKFEHHAPASCPDQPAPCGNAAFRSPQPNPQILYGAMVAGPAGEREDKKRPDYTYRDVRDDYVTNEVACDYNAGLTTALVGLYEQLKG